VTLTGGRLRGGDGITIGNIPDGLDVVAGYTGGRWKTYAPLVAKYPHALHLAYAINAWTWGDCLDDEPGDATPSQVEGWMDNIWKPVNTPKPAVYTSAAVMGAMLAQISRPRSSYLLLCAHYTNVPHICTSAACWPSSPIPWVADGTQWSDNGGAWDSLLFQEWFFNAPTPPRPTKEQELIIIHSQSGQAATFDGAHKVYIAHQATVDALRAAGIPQVEYVQADYDNIPNAT
jgi:hypothetical protein